MSQLPGRPSHDCRWSSPRWCPHLTRALIVLNNGVVNVLNNGVVNDGVSQMPGSASERSASSSASPRPCRYVMRLLFCIYITSGYTSSKSNVTVRRSNLGTSRYMLPAYTYMWLHIRICSEFPIQSSCPHQDHWRVADQFILEIMHNCILSLRLAHDDHQVPRSHSHIQSLTHPIVSWSTPSPVQSLRSTPVLRESRATRPSSVYESAWCVLVLTGPRNTR